MRGDAKQEVRTKSKPVGEAVLSSEGKQERLLASLKSLGLHFS